MSDNLKASVKAIKTGQPSNGIGDLFISRLVTMALVSGLFGNADDLEIQVKDDYDFMRRSLRGAASTPLEDLAIERIIVTSPQFLTRVEC
ncbi:MAG TPA: hypothetical protein VG944_11460 [Fimbriimonas sp.]|nr:hypothetical protein [Fimbriimonas sp.]